MNSQISTNHSHEKHAQDNHALPELFAEHGLRCTRQRRALYEALMATNKHPTADELFATVSTAQDHAQHKISLATVYNTLEAFCQAGLAIKLPGKGSCSRYDASTHNHLHMRDTHTGQVIDAPNDISRTLMANLPQNVLDQIESQLGFKVNQVQIELVGEFTNQANRANEAAKTDEHPSDA